MIGRTYDIHGEPGAAQWNGFCLVYRTFYAIRLDQEPTDEEAILIIKGFEAGLQEGKHLGRSILQNEFRNLMNCQPR